MPAEITRRQFVQGAASLAAMGLLGSCSRLATTLEGRGGAAPPEILLEALNSDDLAAQSDAARLLGDLGSRQAVGPLVRYVRTSRRYVKTAGLDSLGRLGDRSACPGIRPLLSDPAVWDDDYWYGSASVRVAAALALLALGDEAGMDLLMDPAQDHKDWALFTWFGPTALRLGDSPAARRLKARFTMDKVLPTDKSDPGQLVVVCQTLGLMNTPESRQALGRLLEFRSRYVRGRAAVALLAASPGAEELRRVADMAGNDPALFARVKACQALVSAGRPEHAEAIAQAARSADDEFDRAAALDSLGAIALSKFVSAAAEQLGSKGAYVRLCAVEALDRIGTPAAVGEVERCRKDGDLRVRLAAAKCLAAHA